MCFSLPKAYNIHAFYFNSIRPPKHHFLVIHSRVQWPAEPLDSAGPFHALWNEICACTSTRRHISPNNGTTKAIENLIFILRSNGRLDSHLTVRYCPIEWGLGCFGPKLASLLQRACCDAPFMIQDLHVSKMEGRYPDDSQSSLSEMHAKNDDFDFLRGIMRVKNPIVHSLHIFKKFLFFSTFFDNSYSYTISWLRAEPSATNEKQHIMQRRNR